LIKTLVMKKIIFLTAIILKAMCCLGQEIIENPAIQVDTAAHKICYKGVIDAPGQKKDDLFTNAREWYQKDFEFSHAFVTMADRGSGHLIGRATEFGFYVKGLVSLNFNFAFIIDIRVKDGKVRYEITDFTILDDITDDLYPVWFSADKYVNDPKYKNKKGEFTGKALRELAYIDGNAKMLITGLKDDIVNKTSVHKSDEDDF
jgi:hypothetical protein